MPKKRQKQAFSMSVSVAKSHCADREKYAIIEEIYVSVCFMRQKKYRRFAYEEDFHRCTYLQRTG